MKGSSSSGFVDVSGALEDLQSSVPELFLFQLLSDLHFLASDSAFALFDQKDFL
jgi:hypothetical protein